MASSLEFKLPKAFYDDHRDRGLPSGRVVKELSRFYVVRLGPDEYKELLSDARHYASGHSWGMEVSIGLIASARATVRRLTA